MPPDLHLVNLPTYIFGKLKAHSGSTQAVILSSLLAIAMTSLFLIQWSFYRSTIQQLQTNVANQERTRLEQFALLRQEVAVLLLGGKDERIDRERSVASILNQTQADETAENAKHFAEMRADINDWFNESRTAMAGVSERRDLMQRLIATKLGIPEAVIDEALKTGRMPEAVYPVRPK
jgi:low affinity Fe/Cu permease